MATKKPTPPRERSHTQRAAQHIRSSESGRPGQAPAPRVAPPRAIKVRATQLGYYGEMRRREGDVFVLHDEKLFSKKWMERVDPRTPERITTGKQHLQQVHDDIMRSRAPGGLLTDAELPPTGDYDPLNE